MKRTVATWLAIAGMVLNALWPLLANAGPAAFSAPICSTVGTHSAPLGAGDLPLHPAPAKTGAAHCPLCFGVSDQTPGLTSHIANTLHAPLGGVPPVAAIALPLDFFLMLAAHPRGPPSSSV